MGDRLAFIEPMMPTLVDKPPKGDDWLPFLLLVPSQVSLGRDNLRRKPPKLVEMGCISGK